MAKGYVRVRPLRIVWAAFRNRAGNRLLSLAMLAVFLQATLPFLTTNCPFYQAVHSIAHTGSMAAGSMPADCPMLAASHTGTVVDRSHANDPRKPHAVAFCALCNVLSTFHGYVAAGLLSLPPPQAVSRPVFVSALFGGVRIARAASFSARAPPALI